MPNEIQYVDRTETQYVDKVVEKTQPPRVETVIREVLKQAPTETVYVDKVVDVH